MEGTFYLAGASFAATTTTTISIIGTVYLGDIAFTVFYYAFSLDDIGVL